MARRISISLPWDPRDATQIFERARDADEAGVETIWMNEGFGHDAFSGLTLLATHTSNARIGTAIVNAYSRTPGALAQHFATIDQLSEGRVIIGLGTSGPGVIERFHGMPFQPAITRLREVVELLRAIWRHERITHHGQWYDIERALVMGVDPVQADPPIYLATLRPKSVRMTAELADGWIGGARNDPQMLGEKIGKIKDYAMARGRDPKSLSFGSLEYMTLDEDVERARDHMHSLTSSVYGPNFDTGGSATFGPPEACIARLQAVIDAGCTEVIVCPPDLSIGQITRVAEEVAPKLKR